MRGPTIRTTCSPGDTSWRTQTFAADKIRIGYSGATISNAMLWVTEEGKLFEKNGIDAEILYLRPRWDRRR